MKREQVPLAVSKAMGGRPVRWAPPLRAGRRHLRRLAPTSLLLLLAACRGDFDGRAHVLEIFMAEAAEQRRLLRAVRARRAKLNAAAGGLIVFVFHTPAESMRLYGPFLAEFQTSVEP
jgi:hypothetical protein